MKLNLKSITQGLLFVIIILAFIYIGTRDFSQKVQVDNERFDLEYTSVSKDNVFVYATANEVYTKLKNGSAVIFFGFKDNIWGNHYVKMLNDAAHQANLKEILYYDFQNDRKMRNATYESIVFKLQNYLPHLDDNRANIYAPTLVIVKNGKIIAYDNETAINIGSNDPEIYWDQNKMGQKLNYFKSVFLEYLNPSK